MPAEQKTLPSFAQAEVGASNISPCLTDDEILAFVQGELDQGALDRVHVHIDGCDDCQRIVAETTHALDMEPVVKSGRISWNAVFQLNSVVGGRYRVLDQIGSGGMGQVFRAFDVTLNAQVALKTVTSTACDSVRAVRQLKAEVQLARRITHPNVCSIYDLQTHSMQPSGEQIAFLVMEYVEGECLGRRLRGTGALSPTVAVSTARQLLQGLHAAHCAGILHRDFKSENVMLRARNDGHFDAVILDFGLAKALNDSGSAATTQTQGKSLIGTLSYMAPEQIEGKPLSRATDIYSFGVVFYEMLIGKLPFEAGSLAAAVVARLQRDPDPPSRVDPNVPKWLDGIVLRCLSRDGPSRYANAQQVLDAIDAAMAPPQETVPLPGLLRDRRYRLLATMAACTVGALLATFGHPRHDSPPPPALLPPREATAASASEVQGRAESEQPAVGVSVEPEAVPTASQRAVASLTVSTVKPSAASATGPTRTQTQVKRSLTHARDDEDGNVSSLPSETQEPAIPRKRSDGWLGL